MALRGRGGGQYTGAPPSPPAQAACRNDVISECLVRCGHVWCRVGMHLRAGANAHSGDGRQLWRGQPWQQWLASDACLNRGVRTLCAGAQADADGGRQLWRGQLRHVRARVRAGVPVQLAQRAHQRHGGRPGSRRAGAGMPGPLHFLLFRASGGAASGVMEFRVWRYPTTRLLGGCRSS